MIKINDPVELVIWILALIYSVGIVIYNVLEYYKDEEINIGEIFTHILLSPVIVLCIICFVMAFGPMIFWEKYGKLKRKKYE